MVFIKEPKTLETAILNQAKFCSKKPKILQATILNLTRFFNKNVESYKNSNVESDKFLK